MRYLIPVFGVLLIVTGFMWPFGAMAGEKVCQFALAPTLMQLQAKSVPHVVLPPNNRDHFIAALESEIGFHFPKITNVLIANLGGTLVYGLEIDGCLTPPRAVSEPAPPAKRSGMTPAGVFA